MKPFKLKPFYKDYLWGGDRLATNYNKKTTVTPLAESWELSAHKDGPSVISDVSCADDEFLLGMAFSDFVEKYGGYCGLRMSGEFPILIKLIDAKNDLSVQVHPDDAFAFKHENSPGKTELWHILEADEGSFLYVGLNRDVGRGEFAELIESGRVVPVLNKIPVKRGDTFFIGAGTIHAINSGIVLAEIQQNSNLTYRVYDYGRRGADGSERELHIEKAIKVADLNKYKQDIAGASTPFEEMSGYSEKTVVKCPYFTVKAISVKEEYRYSGSDETFASLLFTDGRGEITSDGGLLTAQKGDSVFVPAGLDSVVVSGTAEFLLTTRAC